MNTLPSETVNCIATITVICISTVIVLLMTKYFFLKKKKIHRPPYNKESKSLTLTRIINGEIVNFRHEKCQELGYIWRINIFGFSRGDVMVISDPTFARHILETYHEKTVVYKRMEAMHGGIPSLLTKHTEGEGWDWARKGVAKSFSMTNLYVSMEKLHMKLDILDSILRSHQADNSFVNISEVMINLTFDYLTSAMYGKDFNFLEGSTEGRLIQADLNTVLREFGMKSLLNPFRSYMFWDKDLFTAHKAATNLSNALSGILKHYRDTHTAEETKVDPSILAHLIRSKYPTDKERIADMTIFLIAGHDTTGYTLAFTILEIARHPKVAKKLREEITTFIPPTTKNIDVNQLSNFKYLDSIIKESMRMWPVAGLGPSRHLDEDIEYKGYYIPKGSKMSIAFYSIFRSGIKVLTHSRATLTIVTIYMCSIIFDIVYVRIFNRILTPSSQKDGRMMIRK
jgi:cytochrome P450